MLRLGKTPLCQRADRFAAYAHIVGWIKRAVGTNYETPYEIPPGRNSGQIERSFFVKLSCEAILSFSTIRQDARGGV